MEYTKHKQRVLKTQLLDLLDVRVTLRSEHNQVIGAVESMIDAAALCVKTTRYANCL